MTMPDKTQYKKRFLEAKLREASQHFPSVTIIGPRQSGKTVLVRKTLPHYSYINLEDPEMRSFALEDPRGLISHYLPKGVIFDEVQRVPELLSYIQVIIDQDPRPGRFVLTGSGRFQLMRGVTQSLAGRTFFLTLLPFSLRELLGLPPISLEELGDPQPEHSPPFPLEEILFKGLFPPIHHRNLPARDWLASYYIAYVEKDIRDLSRLGDLGTFQRFLRLCAGRVGQLLNLSSLASDAGISHTTARRWISLLEAAFVIYLLKPHYQNFSKRVVKSPKIYFYDTGLLCYLLEVKSPQDLPFHPLRGNIFENFVFTELYKAFSHRGEEPPLYFWRDQTGHEIDFLIEKGHRLIAIEAKAGATVTRDQLKNLIYYSHLAREKLEKSILIYAGEKAYVREGIKILPWLCL